jgi:hypothetical protein
LAAPVAILTFLIGIVIWNVLPESAPKWPAPVIAVILCVTISHEVPYWGFCRGIIIRYLRAVDADFRQVSATSADSELRKRLERWERKASESRFRWKSLLAGPVVIGALSVIFVEVLVLLPGPGYKLELSERLEMAAVLGTFLLVYLQHPRHAKHFQPDRLARLTFLWSIICITFAAAGAMLFPLESIIGVPKDENRLLWHIALIIFANFMICVYDDWVLKSILDPQKRERESERFALVDLPVLLSLIFFFAGLWFLVQHHLDSAETLLPGALVMQFYLSALLFTAFEDRIAEKPPGKAQRAHR